MHEDGFIKSGVINIWMVSEAINLKENICVNEQEYKL